MSASRQAFSLLEVVFAVAIFAGAVVGVAALFSPTARSVSELGDAARAAGLAVEVQHELERLRDGFAAAPEVSSLDLVAAAIGSDGLQLVADRHGRRIQMAQLADGLAPPDRYFSVLVQRLVGGLAHQNGAGFLALSVTVRWPSWNAAGAGAESMTIYLALRP